METSAKIRVAIVGAGASGIPAAKEALDHGLEPVIFEASTDIGGLWRYKPYETDEGTVMKSTVINTSKEMTAYSTFLPPSHFANFMHNRYMLEYLRLFANSFNFHQFLRLQHEVVDVRRAEGFEESGKWTVKYRKPDGSLHCEEFHAVLLCTGHHTRPYLPTPWPGQQHFKGNIIHAHSYKDHSGGRFDDKVVVVVGVGNSGVDITVELSRVAKEVYLVTRRGTWVLHRNLDHSVPFDIALNTRLLKIVGDKLPKGLTAWYLQKIFERRLDHEKFGLKPNHSILSAHLTINDELPNRLCCGTVRVKPNIREFLANGKGVVFEDGTELAQVDHVILATGYSFGFPLVEDGNLIPVQENQVSLYQNMYPPDLHAHNTLAIIGLIQPLGSIMPISEMQARLFFEAFTGRVKLPCRQGMLANIGQKREQMEMRYVRSRRHTIQVDYVEYMDELAELIGCQPQVSKYALSDPALFYALIFGPNAPYVYRLDGPGKWEGARETILTINERILAGMRGIELPSKTMGNVGNGILKNGKDGDGAWKAKVSHQNHNDGMPPLIAFFLIALALTFWAVLFNWQ